MTDLAEVMHPNNLYFIDADLDEFPSVLIITGDSQKVDLAQAIPTAVARVPNNVTTMNS